MGTIAIAAPTGNIGKRLVPLLIGSGHRVVLVARSPQKIDPEIAAKVDIRQAALEDALAIKKALADADSVYWLNPGNRKVSDPAAWYVYLGELLADVIAQGRIRSVVNVSSAGADTEEIGPVYGLGLVEKILNKTSAHVAHLRPAYFMENLLYQIDDLKTKRAIIQPVDPSRAISFIAASDIAKAASEYLLSHDWSGKIVRDLYGPSQVTFRQAAKILSDATGVKIAYVYIPLDEARSALIAQGASERQADAYASMFKSMNNAVDQPHEIPRNALTSTTLRQWGSEVLRPLLAV